MIDDISAYQAGGRKTSFYEGGPGLKSCGRLCITMIAAGTWRLWNASPRFNWSVAA